MALLGPRGDSSDGRMRHFDARKRGMVPWSHTVCPGNGTVPIREPGADLRGRPCLAKSGAYEQGIYGNDSKHAAEGPQATSTSR